MAVDDVLVELVVAEVWSVIEPEIEVTARVASGIVMRGECGGKSFT